MSGRKQKKGIAVAAFARSVGVNPNAVHHRIKTGSLADAVHDDGSLDEEQARVLWFANANPSYMRSRRQDELEPPPGKKTAANAAKARGEFQIKTDRAEVELEMARLKLAEMKREYVPADEVRRAQRAVARTTRDMFLNFAARHGGEMAGELGVDPGQLIGLLEAHIRKALNEAASAPMPDDDPDDEAEGVEE